jgi:hemerythrin-like domain-containing protein
MIEHRLIERMVKLLKDHAKAVEAGVPPDEELLRAAVDFFRVYADRTHHGKEEDILFKALAERELSDEHRRIMDELVDEHKTARRLVGELEAAGEKAAAAGGEAADEVQDCLGRLVALYVPHIEKEDKHFFLPVMDYFSDEEQQEMLAAFREFDAGMIREKYEGVVEAFEPKG